MPTNLGVLLRRWRLFEDLSLRQSSKTLGIGAATLMRLEAGRTPDVETWFKIQAWLFAPNQKLAANTDSTRGGAG